MIVNKDEDTKKRKANKMLRKDKKGEKNIERQIRTKSLILAQDKR